MKRKIPRKRAIADDDNVMIRIRMTGIGIGIIRILLLDLHNIRQSILHTPIHFCFTSFRFSTDRADIATFTLALARRIASALPMPLEAPVIHTTRP